MKHPKFCSVLLVSLLMLLQLAGCGTNVVNPVTGREERTVMDENTEVEEGRKAHEQVLTEMGTYDNPRVQAYVNALGQKLAKQSHRSSLKWTFTVVDSPDINAFALPGGYVYVTRGIMAYMDSEADLAGVIGHEIGHVTARHGAQRATRQQNAGIGVLAASVLGAVLEVGGVRGAGQLAQQASQTYAAGKIASYGRDQELQADQLGAEYLARSNFDPKNMVDVIGVLKNQERFAADSAKAEGKPAPSGVNWLSSHPSNDQRLQEITQAAAAASAKHAGKYDDDGRERYLQAVSGMNFGESASQGLTRGRQFFHSTLGFTLTAPPGFSIQNGAEALTLVNAAGDAALVLQPVPPKAGATHEEVLKNVFKPTQGRSERYAINGLDATHYVGTRAGDQGAAQNFETTLVTGPANNMYALRYVGKDAAAVQRAHASLREAEASFRAMNAADKAAAKPWALKMVPLPAGGLAELARKSPLANAERQLKLINGVYAGGDLRVGQLVKVVE
jgi:predicted Zn-dependent protease